MARAEAAEKEVARLRSLLGRPPARARDERGQLIEAACKAQRLTRAQLAERLGVDPARLAPSGSFPEARREELLAALRDMVAEIPSGSADKGRRRRKR